ncbi:MAG: 4-(cytidine 5'-diphospho)-2-C-methyl-D-erythritol kinase [Lachnospiraceae bacterium]|nr:4-(cytidine 5'-diphospho)-2-C-methyl-D-erythritol kinase [Lachnospiraceae bacterium]
MAISKSVKERAYAKINLGLDVLRKREDGYHDVKMVMQTIGICDELYFSTTPETKGISLVTDDPDLPTDENNLIVKAARLILDKYNVRQGIEIELQKNIPTAAGMAGGSSDAAAAFRGLNRLFGLGLTEEELCKMAVSIGADVPYCIYGGTYLSEGIGEKLTRLPDIPYCTVLVAKPNFGVSTGFVYSNLALDKIEKHPDMDKVIECVNNKDIKGIAENMENILETVSIKEYPFIGEIKDIMLKHGAMNSLMSGSGPTVFGLYDNKANAERAAVELRRLDEVSDVIVTCFEDLSSEEIRKKAQINIQSTMDDEETLRSVYDCVAIEKRGTISVKYHEKDADTGSDTENVLTISDRKLVYKKTGLINTEMLITPDEATSQIYNTPLGDIEINIICHEFVLNEIADRLVLELDYDLMQESDKMNHCNMKIEVEYNI